MTGSVDVVLESECTAADVAAVGVVFEAAGIRADVRGGTFANQRLIFPG